MGKDSGRWEDESRFIYLFFEGEEITGEGLVFFGKTSSKKKKKRI